MNKEINISEMTVEYAQVIPTWSYEGVYSVYNHSEDFPYECMDGMHFVFTDNDGQLLGYFCFGEEAKIPTVEKDAYDNDFIDIGLHIRPDLCGKKLGSSFMNVCLDYAKEKFNTNHFRATIAAFNKRALALCTSAGFYPEKTATHASTKKKFIIVKRSV